MTNQQKEMAKKRAIRHHGHWRNRFKDNPEERRFADAWRHENTTTLHSPLLAQLMGDGREPATDISQRDATVAATVIQWLGSPVGRCFLLDLGYERR